MVRALNLPGIVHEHLECKHQRFGFVIACMTGGIDPVQIPEAGLDSPAVAKFWAKPNPQRTSALFFFGGGIVVIKICTWSRAFSLVIFPSFSSFCKSRSLVPGSVLKIKWQSMGPSLNVVAAEGVSA